MQRLHVPVQVEASQLFKQLVLEVLLEEEVKVDNHFREIFVVLQNLLKEIVFVLLEEGKRVVAHQQLLSSLEELHGADVDLVEVNAPHAEHLLRDVVSLLVYSGKFDDFVGREVGEDSGGRPNS